MARPRKTPKAGYSRNLETGRIRKSCRANQFRNPKTGRCNLLSEFRKKRSKRRSRRSSPVNVPLKSRKTYMVVSPSVYKTAIEGCGYDGSGRKSRRKSRKSRKSRRKSRKSRRKY